MKGVYVGLFIFVTSLASAVVIRDYNYVDFFEYNNLEDVRKVYFTNNDKSTSNVVVGVADESCIGNLASPAFKGIQRYAGAHVIDSF